MDCDSKVYTRRGELDIDILSKNIMYVLGHPSETVLLEEWIKEVSVRMFTGGIDTIDLCVV